MRSLSALFKPTTSPAKTKLPSPSTFPNSPPYQIPTETQFVSLIHISKTTLQLRQVHARILIQGLSSSSVLTTQLISASSSRNSVDYSLSIFNRYSPNNNLFTFNALIRGLVKNSRFDYALSYFVVMLRSDVRPDCLTYPFVLESVAGLDVNWVGGLVHGMVVKCGAEFDSFVRISLVSMYVKVEGLGLAYKVFDESPQRFGGEGTLLWNILINGFCKAGDVGKAVELFEAMPERNAGSWNNLIDGLLKNGDLNRAKKYFDLMPEKNVVSWTTMVNGLSQNGNHEKALSMFSRMMEEDVRPNSFTIVCALSACAKIGAFDAGLRIHNYMKENGFKVNLVIGNALMDMYAKCGSIKAASKVFKEMKEKDILTWSVMIWGWAIHGDANQAIQCFKQMMFAGIKPDEVVFLGVLTACTHSGQVDLGLNFFESMRLDYSIEPTMKHYTLIVDLLGRAGRLSEALGFIQEMPISPDFVVWGALFCACRAQKNIELAELASQKLLALAPKHPGNYVFLSNVYAAVGRWEDVARVRVSMQKRGVKKDPGWSYIEVEGMVHSFVAGNCSRKDAKDIQLKLDEIMAGARKVGYVPGTEWVLHNVEEEEKEDALGSHSEKLALAFGFIRTSPGETIRIVKNLRVCGDCHSLFKHASKRSGREIILRDIKRFHHFKDGACSCLDFW